MKFRRTSALIAALCSVALISACGGGDDEAAATGSAKLKLIVNRGIMAHVPLQVAADQGFFKDNGLDVEIIESETPGPAIAAAIAAGQTDLGVFATDTGISSVRSGVELQAVVGLTGGGGNIVITRADLDAGAGSFTDQIETMKGKTVSTYGPGGTVDRMFRYLFDGAGVKVEYATVVGVAPTVAALKSGTVDVAASDLLSGLRAEKDASAKILWDLQETGPEEFLNAATIEAWASSDLVSDRPDDLEAFARSIAQADAWLSDPDNFAEAKPFVTELAGVELNDDDIKRVLAASSPVVGDSDIAAWSLLSGDGKSPKDILAPMAPKDEAAAEALSE